MLAVGLRLTTYVGLAPHQNEQGEIKLVRTRKKLAGEGSHTAQLCSVSSFLLFPRGLCFLGRTRKGENEKVEKTSRLGLSFFRVLSSFPRTQGINRATKHYSQPARLEMSCHHDEPPPRRPSSEGLGDEASCGDSPSR